MSTLSAAAADKDGDEINALRARVAELEALIAAAPQPAVNRVQQAAAQKDAVFEASIDFIETLTGMEPPSIEAAPPEIFKPFRDFTERVLTIFHDERQSPHQPLTDERINAVITEQWGSQAIHEAHRAFARAIERAHGIMGDAE